MSVVIGPFPPHAALWLAFAGPVMGILMLKFPELLWKLQLWNQKLWRSKESFFAFVRWTAYGLIILGIGGFVSYLSWYFGGIKPEYTMAPLIVILLLALFVERIYHLFIKPPKK